MLIFCSCASNKKEDEAEKTRAQLLFPLFPIHQFGMLKLGEDIDEVKSKLEQDGFSVKEDQPNHYWNDGFEIEVILPEPENMNTHKLVLPEHLNHYGSLFGGNMFGTSLTNHARRAPGDFAR